MNPKLVNFSENHLIVLLLSTIVLKIEKRICILDHCIPVEDAFGPLYSGQTPSHGHDLTLEDLLPLYVE